MARENQHARSPCCRSMHALRAVGACTLSVLSHDAPRVSGIRLGPTALAAAGSGSGRGRVVGRSTRAWGGCAGAWGSRCPSCPRAWHGWAGQAPRPKADVRGAALSWCGSKRIRLRWRERAASRASRRSQSGSRPRHSGHGYGHGGHGGHGAGAQLGSRPDHSGHGVGHVGHGPLTALTAPVIAIMAPDTAEPARGHDGRGGCGVCGIDVERAKRPRRRSGARQRAVGGPGFRCGVCSGGSVFHQGGRAVKIEGSKN